MSTTMRPSRDRLLRPAQALAAALLCLLSTGSAQLVGSARAATPAGAATTPTVTVPASARAKNGLDATSSAAPSTAGGTSAPAASGTASTPTTTYSPSAGTPPPSATAGATPGAASTAPGATASTPAVGAPTVATPATSAARAAAAARAHTTATKGDQPLSTGAIVIAALAALLVLVCAAWGLARLTVFEPRWLISLRHSLAEAGFRASATWSEFADWTRLGH